MKKSVLNYIWKINEYCERDFITILQKYTNNDVIAKLLAQRNINLEGIPNFLNSKIKDYLSDPFHLNDMKLAVERVITAIIKKEKICIFADYDVDGATSAALLKIVLSHFNNEIVIYVPDRLKEGYGPNIEAMKYLKSINIDLVVSADCGTTSYEALSVAHNIGLDVIIIDHHIANAALPKSLAIINPNRLDQESDYKNLAAVGVVFLFCVALLSSLKKTNFSTISDQINLLNYLDLVALGTVCDSVPLIGLNRAFVTQGLKVLNYRRNLGLKALCDISVINSEINTYHLGFVLGPKINAAGRIGKSEISSKLLSTTCSYEAMQLAEILDKYNQKRKQIEDEAYQDAFQKALKQSNNNYILVSGNNWHSGIIGIIAGKLKEIHNKLTIVISWDGEIGKASCRSVAGIDIGNKIIIAKTQGILLNGGGHAMAAGFTINKLQIDAFISFLTTYLEKDLEQLISRNVKFYDIEVDGMGVNLSLWENIIKISPFGIGNPIPIIKINDLYVLKAKVINNKHINCLLATSNKGYGTTAIKAIAFNSFNNAIGNTLLSSRSHQMAVLGQIDLNCWQGKENIQINIHDIII